MSPLGLRLADTETVQACMRCGKPLPDGAPTHVCRLRPEPAVQVAESAERYCLGLIVSEAGEALQDLGNAVRFGLDTPHGPEAPETARTHLVHELGDLLAAVEFACLHGVFDRAGIEAARDRKLARLCDPANRDHLGRPLAPRPIALGPVPLPCRIDGWTVAEGRLALRLEDGGAVYGFELDPVCAARLRQACYTAYPELADPARTRLTTSRREASLATFVFERDGAAFELALDWETAREVRTHIDARFPDAGR